MADGFFAYPSQPAQVAEIIRTALKTLKEEHRQPDLHGWEENDIPGRFIIDPILSEISTSKFVAADVTKLNFNVAYEIGYAIGRERRLFLTRNDAFLGDDTLIREVGIFDTIGFKPYQDSRQLATLLSNLSDFKPLAVPKGSINRRVPVYIILPKTRTDREVHLLSRCKKANLRFRSFDPLEQTRLSGFEAIKEVANSYGVIVPLGLLRPCP